MRTIQERISQIKRHEAQAITELPETPDYSKAVDLIKHHVNTLGGKLICSGMGKAGQVAMNIATTFSSTGTPAIFLHPAEAQHGDLGIMQTNDIMLLLSNSGKTREILELIALAKNLNHSLPLIVITGDDKSPLAKAADAMLPTGGAPEVCPLGLTPTTSTTLMTVIGDILVVSVMEEIGFTADDYAKRHHRGYLGHLSSQKATANHNKTNDNTEIH